jgi:nucleoside 2-deoxyribosyltransferase
MINVHIIASKKNVLNNIELLRKISTIIRAKGHVVMDDWIEVTYDLRVNKKDAIESIDWASIYTDNLENIAKADVIIAETTYDTFGVGYQIAIAAQQKKPILLLRHDDAEVDSFAMGIVDSWVQRAIYNEHNLDDILQKFLDENDISVKDMRFNFFIDRQIYNYLRWSSLKTGKTKAEILRELVTREIDKNEP